MRAVAAQVASRAAGVAGATLRHLPEAAGALLMAYGLGLAWRPLGYIAVGAFLLLAGRNTP